MASKFMLPLLLLFIVSPSMVLAALDVPQMLADKSQYGTFLRLLTQTKIAEDIKRLKSASLLVLQDKAVKPIESLPADKQRLAIANHVILKYIDPIQLGEMKERTAIIPTLLSNFDKSLGVVNYTKADDGQMYFGAPGAACVAKLIKVVAARPYAISIMEVNEAILPPALGGGGRRPKGGKGKRKPTSASLGESNIAGAKPVGQPAAKVASAPTTTPK